MDMPRLTEAGMRRFTGLFKLETALCPAHSSSGDSIDFPQLYVTQGAHFGDAFNPDDVKTQVVGNASLSFSDCNTGTFRYNAFGQAQTLPMQRLTQTMGASCQPINGVPGEPVMDYAGQSGS